tara:strand:- start:252 stop:1031 length:780 start_codon:yes stop_codon:yes gene_type:complete
MYELRKMTDAEYFAHPAINRSTLWKMGKSPYHSTILTPRTDALDLGTAAHLVLLENADDRITFWDGDRRTKAGKAAYAEFEADNIENERVILKKNDYCDCLRMVEAVRGHSVAKKLFAAKGETEITAIWMKDGLTLKAKYDFLALDSKYAVDFKTTVDASPNGFARSVSNYGYYFQAAFYLDAIPELERFYFVCAEKKTNAVAVYHLDRDSAYVQYGRSQIHQYLKDYAEADLTGQWRGYTDDESIELLAPYWMQEATE